MSSGCEKLMVSALSVLRVIAIVPGMVAVFEQELMKAATAANVMIVFFIFVLIGRYKGK